MLPRLFFLEFTQRLMHNTVVKKIKIVNKKKKKELNIKKFKKKEFRSFITLKFKASQQSSHKEKKFKLAFSKDEKAQIEEKNTKKNTKKK